MMAFERKTSYRRILFKNMFILVTSTYSESSASPTPPLPPQKARTSIHFQLSDVFSENIVFLDKVISDFLLYYKIFFKLSTHMTHFDPIKAQWGGFKKNSCNFSSFCIEFSYLLVQLSITNSKSLI